MAEIKKLFKLSACFVAAMLVSNGASADELSGADTAWILTATAYLRATSGDMAHSVYPHGSPSPATPAPAIEAPLAAPRASPASVPRGANDGTTTA